MYLICMLIAFLACVLGKICGMGGGVIIKPVLDALGVASVSAINFLSGCTVIGMSLWSVGKSYVKRDSQIDLKISTPLAIGAAVGGILGKSVYSAVAGLFPSSDTAGGVQAILLLAATFGTLLYTLNKDKIRMLHVKNPLACVAIGFALGMLGSFLGIGGGPFNVALLSYFFSMPTKKATQNSLLIVLFSQLTSTVKTIAAGAPAFDPAILAGMILLAILGSEVGRRINKKIDNRQATLCLEGAMVLIMAINVYNAIKFLG